MLLTNYEQIIKKLEKIRRWQLRGLRWYVRGIKQKRSIDEKSSQAQSRGIVKRGRIKRGERSECSYLEE
jgi:hypothetical protein